MRSVNENRNKPVVLFDGVCNLCNWWVNWLGKRDKKGIFRLAHLQSPAANDLFKSQNIPPSIQSVVLVENDTYYVKSDAVLRIVKRIGGIYKFLLIFKLLPKGLRDKLYDFVARKRYQWFGRKDSCQLPPPELRKRFLPQAFGE